MRALQTQIDTLALGEGILCEPGVYIILTQSTQHTDTMIPEVGILCVPEVYIILTYSTQHTDRYNGPSGRYTMCSWCIHHTAPQNTQIDTMALVEGLPCVHRVYVRYTDSRVHNTLKDSVTPGEYLVCVPGVCIMRTRTLYTD